MAVAALGALVQLLHQEGEILVVAVDELVELSQLVRRQFRFVQLSDDAPDGLGRERACLHGPDLRNRNGMERGKVLKVRQKHLFFGLGCERGNSLTPFGKKGVPLTLPGNHPCDK